MRRPPWLEEKYAKKLPQLVGSLRRAEPEILISIADRIPKWSAVLALVGGGQEIFNGEEAGIGQWADATARSNVPWDVHGPPALASGFRARGIIYTSDDALTLDTSLRAQAASDLHSWVENVLDSGSLNAAAEMGVVCAVTAFRSASPATWTRQNSTRGTGSPTSASAGSDS